ncbi:MAG: hypothetical protein ACJAVN_000560 [Roseivirga sp.]|jgi:hypothetical protein
MLILLTGNNGSFGDRLHIDTELKQHLQPGPDPGSPMAKENCIDLWRFPIKLGMTNRELPLLFQCH